MVKTLVLGQASTSAADDIKAIKLFDSAGVEKASVAPTASGHANFSNLNLELPADQVTSYFIGVQTKTINADGDAAGTADYNEGIRFGFAGASVLTALNLTTTAITAQGVDSGQDIDMSEDINASLIADEYSASTTLSKETLVTGSVLTSVTNSLADGTLSNGTARIIGKYKFVFDNGTNRTASNEEMKAEIRQLILTVATSTDVVLADVKAYIDGNSGTKTSGAAMAGSTVTINLTQLGTTDLVDGEITLVITANVSGVATSDSLSTAINSLSTDFTYNGNYGTSGPNFSDARLDISDVAGANLSN
jgi:hypothetical protein